MAEATIAHFRDFPLDERKAFTHKVIGAVAQHVYGVEGVKDILPPNGVTVRTLNLGEDSHTDATAGTEVTVALDAEEWPYDEIGQRVDADIACARNEELSRNIGQALLGGVMYETDAIVNVWVVQFPATGWYEG